MKRKIPLLPNTVTAFGLTCGLFVIFKTNMVDPGEGNYDGLLASAGLLLLAALADLLDGAIARAMKAESEFGGLFDSLADAVSFGVAPSVIALKSLSVEPGTELSFFVSAGAMIFSMCGILRLVRFNVQAIEAQHDEDILLSHKGSFTGLPIPAGAACAVSLNLFLHSPEVTAWFVLGQDVLAIFTSFVMMVLGYLMISRLRFPSPKTLRVRVSSFQLVFVMALTAVLMLYGVIYHFPIAFLLLAWGYVLTGATLSVVRAVAGKRLKALDDFSIEEGD